jgi:hypothetical protein
MCNAQIPRLWCYNHKTWTSDSWKRVIWVDESSFTVPYMRKSLRLENTKGNLQSKIPGSSSETRVGSVMVWAAVSWYSILLVPLLPFMAELLQGSTWTWTG